MLGSHATWLLCSDLKNVVFSVIETGWVNLLNHMCFKGGFKNNAYFVLNQQKHVSGNVLK